MQRSMSGEWAGKAEQVSEMVRQAMQRSLSTAAELPAEGPILTPRPIPELPMSGPTAESLANAWQRISRPLSQVGSELGLDKMVEGAKAAAGESVAAENAASKLGLMRRGYNALKAINDPLAKVAGRAPKGLLPRFVRGVAIPVAAAATAGGLAMNYGANKALSDAQDAPINMLKKYGIDVTRGTDAQYGVEEPNVGLGSFLSWYNPGYDHPASDPNLLKVYTPDGDEIVGGETPRARELQRKREFDLFKAAGLTDNAVRAQKGLPPMYSPADLLANAQKKMK